MDQLDDRVFRIMFRMRRLFFIELLGKIWHLLPRNETQARLLSLLAIRRISRCEVVSSVTSTLVMYRRGHASHSYPACSFLLFIPPLVPRIVSLALLPRLQTLHFAPQFSFYASLPPKVVFICIQSF